MSKFFSKRRFHRSSTANVMPSTSSYTDNSSKSASCPSSSMNIEIFSPQSKKKLTRQRKLRHVTMDDFYLPEEDEGVRSKSLPGSPNLPRHWSFSAVPQPLPRPNDDLRFPGGVENGQSDRYAMTTKSSGIPIPSKATTYHRRKGYPQDVNGKKDEGDIRLDVPAWSAPSTTFTSPTLSPKRFSTVDIFDSTRREFHFSPPYEASTKRSQLYSPALQSNHFNNRTESNNNNVHPLPLPLPPSRPVTRRQSLDRSDGQSIKVPWQKGKILGRGTFGTVYEATNRETGGLCAMKEVDVIPDDPKSSECIRQLEQEIKVLRNLEHPNIVQYLGSEMLEDRFCIYLEYVHPGSINKYVREHCGAVTESIVRNFTRHILSGLAYLHSKKTVHRDIKGANLLVDASGVVKLADFGLAKHLSAQITDLSLKGSPHWMAPEVLQAAMRKDTNPEHTYAMDIWSLGCTVIEMVTGRPPWSEFNGVQAMFNVLHRSPPIPEILSPEGKDFLNRCLQRNPEKRSSAALLLEHSFVRQPFDHNFSLCKNEFSGLKLNEISYASRDSPAQSKYKDMMQSSPCPGVRHEKLQFQCETPKYPHSPATRQSPQSALEVLPTELNFSTRICGISQVPHRMPITRENGRTYSLPTTPNRETYSRKKVFSS